MDILNILMPIYILIGLGFLLNKYNFPSVEFWVGVEKMTYFILFPALIFVAILKAPIDFSVLGKLFVLLLIPVLISGLFQFLGLLSSSLSRPTFTSMYQGATRNNTAISLVIIAWLVPETGLALMAVVILIVVPFNNLTSILVLLRFGDNHIDSGSASLWYGIVKNPLIIATALGFILNVLGFVIPESLLNTADFLGRSALPFALLAVGAGLKFHSLLNNKLAIFLSSFGRLLITPLLTWGLCLLMDMDTDISKVVIIFSAVPTAVSGYILAKAMGGDSEAMAQIITVQTIAAAFTLPLFLIIAQQYV